jgi:hypothetical protein
MNAMHRRLIKHEAGHAIVGLLSGLRVKRVWAPPPEFDGPPENPDDPAGYVDFARGGDRRAKAVALLGGPLAEGKPAPSWPIQPHTDDERKLAKLVGEQDELCYLELVRDADQIVKSDEFGRINMLASELLAHPPHELDGKQLDHIRETTMDTKHKTAFPTRVRVVTDPELAHVREAAYKSILAAFDAADRHAPKPERKTAAPVQIASFEVDS